MVVPYCYGAEQVADSGWGCVYRSWQNALMLQELPHTSISSLVRSVHNPSSRWIEPPQLLTVLPVDAYADTALGVFEDGRSHMLFTTISDYQRIFYTREELGEWLHTALREGASVLIDNGTMCYTVHGGCLYDPHTVIAADVCNPVDVDTLLQRWRLYMCVAVRKRT